MKSQQMKNYVRCYTAPWRLLCLSKKDYMISHMRVAGGLNLTPIKMHVQDYHAALNMSQELLQLLTSATLSLRSSSVVDVLIL